MLVFGVPSKGKRSHPSYWMVRCIEGKVALSRDSLQVYHDVPFLGIELDGYRILL